MHPRRGLGRLQAAAAAAAAAQTRTDPQLPVRRRSNSQQGWQNHGEQGTEFHPADLMEYVKMHRACQAKMLIGLHCNDPRYSKMYFEPTDEHRGRALRNLDRMVFIGLTDYWEASICLFHAQFGGRITEHEMDNVRCVGGRWGGGGGERFGAQAAGAVSKLSLSPLPCLSPGAHAREQGAKARPVWEEKIPIEADPFDWEVFQKAQRIFVRRLIKYGIQVPAGLGPQ